MSGGEVAGEIERAEDGEYAVGFIARRGESAGDFSRSFSAARLIGFERLIDFGEDGIGFGGGFPSRFAGFFADGFDNRGFVLLELLALVSEDLDAIQQRDVDPI